MHILHAFIVLMSVVLDKATNAEGKLKLFRES